MYVYEYSVEGSTPIQAMFSCLPAIACHLMLVPSTSLIAGSVPRVLVLLWFSRRYEAAGWVLQTITAVLIHDIAQLLRTLLLLCSKFTLISEWYRETASMGILWNSETLNGSEWRAGSACCIRNHKSMGRTLLLRWRCTIVDFLDFYLPDLFYPFPWTLLSINVLTVKDFLIVPKSLPEKILSSVMFT